MASKQIDLLRQACRERLQGKWPECEVVAEIVSDDNSVEFVIQLADGSVGIIDKRGRSGSKGSPLNRKWSLDDVDSEVCRCLLKAVRLGSGLFHVSYRPSKVYGGKNKDRVTAYKVSLSRETTQLSWAKIFPDEPVPEMAQWSLASQTAKKTSQYLEVVHTLKNGRARQVNEYKLEIKHLSKAIVDSTLSFKTFPFNIPHSHRIVEGKSVIYDRPIADWDQHVEQKGLLEDSSVQRRQCEACRVEFYDSSSHSRCYACLTALQRKTRDKALKLCQRAEKLSPSCEWKETAEAFKLLQKEWQALESLSKEDGDVLWPRFRGASQAFFDRRSKQFDKLDKQRLANKQKAEGLIAAARQWLEEDDWRLAGEEIKSLQKQWKSVNPLPRECADELWQEFRGYCQSFFDRSAARYEQRKQGAKR